nr:SHC-transforming protein 1 [Pelodiscus sinensis]|eukprot:XP_025042471.1 SHC-transforming protein 1 [Pelodiscus sinensis]
MGCVEVLQSMRMLDFNTRTQVTREAISLVCEAVPGAKGAVRRRKVRPGLGVARLEGTGVGSAPQWLEQEPAVWTRQGCRDPPPPPVGPALMVLPREIGRAGPGPALLGRGPQARLVSGWRLRRAESPGCLQRGVPPVAPAETQVGSSLCSAFVQLKAPRGSGPCLELPRPAAHGHCQGQFSGICAGILPLSPACFLPACHILECPEGLAQDVISTIGQAFELRFKQYLKNPPKLVTPHDRMAGFDGSAWDEEEEEPSDHQYYNDFPGKEPPLGGVVDMRLRDGASAAPTPNHLGATLPVGQMSSGEHDPRKQQPPAQGRDKYAPGAGPAPRPDLFDDPSYVNVQNLDRPRQASAASVPATANGNAQRDLFDMKPFEDALRGPAPGPVGLPPAQLLGCMEEQLGRGVAFGPGSDGRGQRWECCQLGAGRIRLGSTHFPANPEPRFWPLQVRTKDHRFESVSHLISYQMDNHLPIISAGPEL